jgi:hypothetical protein
MVIPEEQMEKKRAPKDWIIVIQGIPLIGALVTSLLPTTQRLGQQFIILIVLLWVQAFFIIEFFLTGR